MGLVGNPSSVLLTTGEMSSEQFAEFKKGWIRYEAIRLQRDGISKPVAERTAADEFAFMEKSGFKQVNDVTLRNRAIRRSNLGS
jgi:hypothetical protein